MKLCMGTVQFGMNYGVQGNKRPDQEAVFEIINCAIDRGINTFDTAAAYGEAEQILGNFFSYYPDAVNKVSVVSKLVPDAFSNSSVDKWNDIALQQVKRSLNNIGIPRFKAYLFHNSSYIFNPKAVEALECVKKNGFSERIGVSVYTPEEALKALEYPQIDTIQIPYNVFDHRLDNCSFFDKAKSKNVLIFARSSLLQGLVMMNPDKLPSNVSFAQNYIKSFHELCKQYDVGILESAVGYVCNKETIDYVVFGVDNLIQLQEYIKISDTKLPKNMLRDIDNSFSVVEDRLIIPSLWK